MIITDYSQHATILARAKCIGVAHDIHTAVDPGRTFAVPHPEHAIVFCVREKVDLLTTPDRRRRQIFIDTRLKVYIVLFELIIGPPQCLVVTAKWGTAITGYKAGGVQTLWSNRAGVAKSAGGLKPLYRSDKLCHVRGYIYHQEKLSLRSLSLKAWIMKEHSITNASWSEH